MIILLWPITTTLTREIERQAIARERWAKIKISTPCAGLALRINQLRWLPHAYIINREQNRSEGYGEQISEYSKHPDHGTGGFLAIVFPRRRTADPSETTNNMLLDGSFFPVALVWHLATYSTSTLSILALLAKLYARHSYNVSTNIKWRRVVNRGWAERVRRPSDHGTFSARCSRSKPINYTPHASWLHGYKTLNFISYWRCRPSFAIHSYRGNIKIENSFKAIKVLKTHNMFIIKAF